MIAICQILNDFLAIVWMEKVECIWSWSLECCVDDTRKKE